MQHRDEFCQLVVRDVGLNNLRDAMNNESTDHNIQVSINNIIDICHNRGHYISHIVFKRLMIMNSP